MNVLNVNKDKEQREHLLRWNDAEKKGTSIAATGLGKTRMGLLALNDILEDEPFKRALIIVPTENLRDNEWLNEFEKWDLKHLLDRVDFQCIQTAYKYRNEHYNIVIVDEVHTTLSPEYRKFYEHNTWDNIYCLTATTPENEEYLEFLNMFAPIVYTTDLNRAVSLGLISVYKVFNLGIPFTAEEAKKYNGVQYYYNMAVKELGGRFQAFENAGKWKNSSDPDQKKWANVFYMMMQKRKKLCYNASNKLLVTKEIIEKFSDRKALVFSESIDFATDVRDTIGDDKCLLFHSKLKKKERQQVLEDFGDQNEYNILSSVKALNAGLNVPECSLGICCAGSSKALDNIQRTGRTLRLQEGKTAIYINLYVTGSQELSWVRKRTAKDYNTQWVTSVEDINLNN